MGKKQNMVKRREAGRKKAKSKRQKFLEEFKKFKAEAELSLKQYHPHIFLFGSLKRGKKNPHDVDVGIDVKGLSDKEFRQLIKKVRSIAKKYKHIDPNIWSWDYKRLPPKKVRDKLRWSEGWDEYEEV